MASILALSLRSQAPPHPTDQGGFSGAPGDPPFFYTQSPALIEAATPAARHPAYRDHYQRTATRLGRQRGKKVARVEVARKLAEAIWHMLTHGEAFAPYRQPDTAAA